jgi:hypothetical protein
MVREHGKAPDMCNDRRMKVRNGDRNPDRPMAMAWPEYEALVRDRFLKLLDSQPDEKPVQKFLEQHPSLLPGAGDIGHGGHHGAWWDAVITQPELKGLGATRYPDFMYVRRDTIITQAVCIEIESPRKPWFNRDLTPSAKLTQALDQLDEWRLWFDKPVNRLIFNQMYVPQEYSDRLIEPLFVLVYGRDSEFRPQGPHQDYAKARAKRDKYRQSDQWIYTFDMLTPHPYAESYGTIRGHRGKFNILNVPATFKTGGYLKSSGSIMDACDDVSDALAENMQLDATRRIYIEERWNFWKQEKISPGSRFRTMELE